MSIHSSIHCIKGTQLRTVFHLPLIEMLCHRLLEKGFMNSHIACASINITNAGLRLRFLFRYGLRAHTIPGRVMEYISGQHIIRNEQKKKKLSSK